MTIQISQRGKEYLETARTLLQQRAEKASRDDAAKACARSAASAEREW